MTPDQIALVEATLSSLDDDLPRVAADFYARLFEAEPALRPLFTGDADHQRRTFAREIAAIMSSIRDHGAFLAEAAALGARHRRYGVREVHYRRAEQPLLGALGTALGPQWTAEVEEAWRLAYHLAAEAMAAGGLASGDTGEGELSPP